MRYIVGFSWFGRSDSRGWRCWEVQQWVHWWRSRWKYLRRFSWRGRRSCHSELVSSHLPNPSWEVGLYEKTDEKVDGGGGFPYLKYTLKYFPGLGARPWTALIRPFGSHTGGVVRPKSHGLGNAWVARWSAQWSHYGLIRGQSLENGLDNGRTMVWSEGKVWKMVWTMVARWSDQRAKSGKWSGQWSHYGLIRRQSRTIVWS